MAVGTLFLCAILLTFSVTHMTKFHDEDASVEMAGELALILLGGFCLYLCLYFLRAVI